jgi:hypothetical protein
MGHPARGLTDSAPEVERLMYEAYRRMLPARKTKLVTDAYLVARQLHAAGHRLRNPGPPKPTSTGRGR